MFFAETWFTNSSDTAISGYQLHRSDRNGRGGGVAIYIRNGLIASEVNVAQLISTANEQIWRILHYGDEAFLLGCLYRPHDLNNDDLDKCISSVTTARNSLSSLKCSAMLLYGDFNFSHTTYSLIDVGGGVATAAHVRDDSTCDLRFQECLNECFLTQLVTFPTYRNNRYVKPSSTLDLVITNDPDRMIFLTKGESLGDTPMGQAHCLISGQFAVANKNTSALPI